MEASSQYACLRSSESGGRVVYLLADAVVGREDRSSVRIRDSRVSAAHARIRYVPAADGWVVRDLGSKNGTKLGDIRIPAGKDVVLTDGCTLRFGGAPTRWEFNAGNPAELVVRRLGDATEHPDEQLPKDGMVVLPSAEDPRSLVFRRAESWILEKPGANAEALVDCATFRVDPHLYEVRICQPERTVTHQDGVVALAAIQLDLVVSRDEEHVAATINVAGVPSTLPSRSRHYLLVVLGRALVADHRRGDSPGEAGWCQVADVQREMALTTPEALNVHVFRVRRDFSRLGLSDPAAIVERRPMSRQMRLGLRPEQVRIHRLT